MIAALRVIALLALCLAGPAPGQPSTPWFDNGRPTIVARQAVGLLADTASDGLDPKDYDAAFLSDALQRAAREPIDPAAADRLQRHLIAAMQRYLGDLHAGRVAVQDLPHGYAAPVRKSFDAAAALQDAVASGQLPEEVRAAAPRLTQYHQLRTALAAYRALAGHPAWKAPLPPLPPSTDRRPPKLEPGGGYAGLAQLRERLIALGDLPASAPPATTYDSTIVDAVKSFQQRHGLTDDGVIGRATLAQLQVSPAARARQIELSLERLRWTPLLAGPRMVVINIPEFVLRTYEVAGDRIVVRETMKIIVGKALDTRTPLFEEQMRYIEFSPYWNVPPSIARNEVVPRLRRDSAYWQREGFEFVTAQGAVVETLSPALLDATLAGAARIRQRPGPRNALGDIKFVFPNRDNIYLHHTPSVGLFERDRRDFSHGCIRVERPVALAMFVLAGMPDWTEARVREAMEAGESKTLRLATPVPVLIAYGTAIVRGGRVHFFDDVYGQDRVLDDALRAPRPPLIPGY
ncbi:MAG TPA: L,D-transpeptidase family protein [Burkholderiaceae bacterium]|nr:L,D-transpeptidase family protein [Burkholderiaceae bacterium]HQR72613.1 L,D-transpeptidase family protein [Burkholderiaceae bacterium]